MGRISSPGNAITYYLKLFIVLLTSTLLAYLGYSLLKQPIILQKMVDQKTAELEQLAFYDPLTSLCNRRLFTDLLNQALSQLIRNDSTLALLYLDLDQFKRINDSMGHEAGDQLLKETAHRLKSNLRQSDVIARIGGDEFCVLISQIKNAEDVGRAAKKIQKILRFPLEIHNQKIIVTPSIGIALAPSDGTESSVLMRNADMAMYSAKNRGRNNYQFYNPKMNKKVMGSLTLESELGKALINNEFVLHYQTQMSLGSNQTVAMEALIRWQHPDRGLVFPDSFIQLAEDTSLIIPIGKWVLCTACTQLKALNIPHLKVAVNLSAIQFNDPDLIKTVKHALEISGLDPSKLELEITESLLMDNIAHAIETLSELKALGITIAIDDFGTGYSSLAQLKNLPADILKIDREFIKDVTTVMENAEITEVIISMGHKLGMKVVAEGVETEEQLAFLVDKGCDIAQGYLFCRPESLEMLQRNNLLDITPSYGKSA
jgi:diguanylate cyclase (GGDEF)-like protein